jgi:hypothetical protein
VSRSREGAINNERTYERRAKKQLPTGCLQESPTKTVSGCFPTSRATYASPKPRIGHPSFSSSAKSVARSLSVNGLNAISPTRALVQLFLGEARQLALRVPRQEQESSEHIDKRQRRYEE